MDGRARAREYCLPRSASRRGFSVGDVAKAGWARGIRGNSAWTSKESVRTFVWRRKGKASRDVIRKHYKNLGPMLPTLAMEISKERGKGKAGRRVA